MCSPVGFGKNNLISRVEEPNFEYADRVSLATSAVFSGKYMECEEKFVNTVNEVLPHLVQPHLVRYMEEGWIVSVGGMRAIFDFLLAPSDRCEGLLVLDQDPKVVLAHRV